MGKKIKVGIVTVYNSLNCGSYLQAFALAEALKKIGYEPVFLDTHSRFPLKGTIMGVINGIKKANISEIKSHINKYWIYGTLCSRFRVLSQRQWNKCGAFILGSDEIWNLNRKQMSIYPIFLGEGLQPEKTFSYAPSLNTTDADDFYSYPYSKKMMSSLRAISVRDSYSKQQIEKYVKREVEVCCDPTFLCSMDDYDNLAKQCCNLGYIFVYEYERLSTEEIYFIKEAARQLEKTIVAMGGTHAWADVVVESNPRTFLSLVSGADYIISGTFHGTVFSIIYKKRFLTFARNNSKILELIKEYDLEDRNYSVCKDPIEVLCKEINRDHIESIIQMKKQHGYAFLEKQLKTIREDNNVAVHLNEGEKI